MNTFDVINAFPYVDTMEVVLRLDLALHLRALNVDLSWITYTKAVIYQFQ